MQGPQAQHARRSKPDVRHFLALTPHLSSQEAEALIELVARHGVTWEVWPERQVLSEEVRQIGFELTLFARHDESRHASYPGCDECAVAYAALKRIASAVTPRGQHDSRYTVLRYDAAMEYPRSSEQGLMRLALKIVHGSGYDRPADLCELECLEEIEARLEALGATCDARILGQRPGHA